MARWSLGIVWAVLAVVAGCAGPSGRTAARLGDDGKAYGVTEGLFRGRWWNYYERGRSFADGAFWKEAEADYRVALASRSRDQLWPRTYGLHFLPEYFPHRELGVVLYHQGLLESGISELELSLQQQYSARAAHFLNRARKDLVESGKLDQTPPELEIEAPTGLVGQGFVELACFARDDTFVSRVTVDGVDASARFSVPEYAFRHKVALKPGDNDVVVCVEDITGKVTERVVTVHADMDGPVICFDGPMALPGRVQGRAWDASGVEAVVMAGREAVLSAGPGGSVLFSVELRDEDLAVGGQTPPRYEARDGLGNLTAGPVRPDLLVLPEAGPRVEPTMSALPAVAEIAPGVAALYRGGEVAAFAALRPEEAQPISLRFANVVEGRRYLDAEALVSLEVLSERPIASLRLNKELLETPDATGRLTVSRRVSLGLGANVLEAVASDIDGHESATRITVERIAPAHENLSARLSVALLGNLWRGNSPRLEGETEFILDAIQSDLGRAGRFTLVDRSLLPDVIQEQQLAAALGSQKSRETLGRLIPAEMMLMGRVRRDHDTIEMILEAVSTETSMFVTRADVAGPADTLDELEQLAGDLAVRLLNDFPRAQGEVSRTRGKAGIVAPASRPRVAVLAKTFSAPGLLTPEEADAAAGELERVLLDSGRYTLVDRDALPALLTEQALSMALGSPEARLALGRVVAADWIIQGRPRVQGDGQTLELEAVNAATGATEARATANDTRGASWLGLARIAGADLAAAIPVPAQGEPELVKTAKAVLTTLGVSDGLRESMKVLVFRPGEPVVDPATGDVLGRDSELVCEALAQSVDDTRSLAVIVAGASGKPPAQIRTGDLVVIK